MNRSMVSCWAKLRAQQDAPVQPGKRLQLRRNHRLRGTLAVAPVRIEDLFVRPHIKTGAIRVQANVRNAGREPAKGRIVLTVASASGGPSLDTVQLQQDLPPEDTRVDAVLHVSGPRLWDLNDPSMYRVTIRVQSEGSDSFDERSTRCGFRDFRMENGYFRLNGRRISPPRGTLTVRGPMAPSPPV